MSTNSRSDAADLSRGVPSARLAKLGDYFPARDLAHRVGRPVSGGKKAIVFFYVTARAVFDRLDEVCGPENWKTRYRPAMNDPHSGSIMCGLSIRVQRGDGSSEWVTKWDAGENTNVAPVKGGVSDSTKRAAVQWGVGRYLYQMPTIFGHLDKGGKKLTSTPTIPAAFLPPDAKGVVEVGEEITEVDGVHEEGPPPKPMTREQRTEIERLMRHPAIDLDTREAYAAWLRGPRSTVIADDAITQLNGMIAEHEGTTAGGDGQA